MAASVAKRPPGRNRSAGYRDGRGARVLVIDNYDSFVYNLVQYLGELGAEPVVHRHDALDARRARRRSRPTPCSSRPGPGGPRTPACRTTRSAHFGEAGVPVLGVCLGHQCIGAALRRRRRARAARDARQDVDDHATTARACSPACPSPFTATRYHSLVVDARLVPDVLEVTAETDDGLVMGLRHRELPDRGRAVPPRVDPHRVGPRPARATSSRSSAPDAARNAPHGSGRAPPCTTARPSSTSDASASASSSATAHRPVAQRAITLPTPLAERSRERAWRSAPSPASWPARRARDGATDTRRTAVRAACTRARRGP